MRQSRRGARRGYGQRLGLGLVLLALSGCIGTSGQTAVPESAHVVAPVFRFPAKAEVERLIASPPALPEAPETATIGDWTLSEQEPNPGQQRFLSELLQDAPNLHASTSLSCAAREWARLYHQYKKGPDDRARLYIVARCGAVVPDVGAFVQFGTADPRQGDAEVLKIFQPALQEGLKKLGDGEQDVGFALFRENTTVVAALTVAPRRVTLAPLTRRLGAEPSVTVRGKMEMDAPAVMALANQGPFGVDRCEADPTVRLPEFVFRCPIAANDPQVWIDLLVQRDNALLLTPVAALLLYRDEAASRTYHPVEIASDTTERANRDSLLLALNTVRGRAGLGPLRLSTAQSEHNSRLAPHFFSGVLANQTDLINRSTLAVLAGFEMEGLIRDANVVGMQTTAAESGAGWVTSALERPFGRFVLLSKEMSEVAIGMLPSSSYPGLGVLISTYQLFDTGQDAAAIEKVLANYNAQRQARGAPPATLWVGNAAAEADMSKFAANQLDENHVVESVGSNFQRSTGRQAVAFMVPTSSLDAIQFPSELLGGGSPTVSIAAIRRRMPGLNWGEYVVLFLYSPGDERPTETARARLERRMSW